MMYTNEKKDITLSVVMPAYNEGAKIRENLLETCDILAKFLKRFEIIAVNDGSRDNTEDGILSAAKCDRRIKAITYDENKGKGGAIREGVLHAKGTYIAFLDSDMEIPPQLLKSYIKLLRKENADAVIGSKLHKESKLEYPFGRRVMSIGYYLFVRLLFGLKLHDTQTGIKLYKHELIQAIMRDLKCYGYTFDIEVLAKADILGAKLVEAPVEINFSRTEEAARRIGIKDAFRMFKDTLAVKAIVEEFEDALDEMSQD